MNVLTFDIEDWYHLLDNPSTRGEAEWSQFPSRVEESTDRILQLLEDTKSRATFFCLGWIAGRFPQVVKRIALAGYEVASHSYGHQLAYEQTPVEFRSDLERAKKSLEDLTGTRVRAHRAPGFSFTAKNTWVFDAMAQLGIEYDSSVFPASRAHGGFEEFGSSIPSIIESHGIEIREFPINFSPVMGRRVVFSGGGYFRLIPYPAIHFLAKQSKYNMLYFHPRDFDIGQPMVPGLSPMRVFRSYYGISSGLTKLRRFIEAFPVSDLDSAAKQVSWSECARIRV